MKIELIKKAKEGEILRRHKGQGKDPCFVLDFSNRKKNKITTITKEES